MLYVHLTIGVYIMSFIVWAYATPLHPTAFTGRDHIEPYPLTLREVGYTGPTKSNSNKQLAVIALAAAGHNAISSPLSNTASPVATVPHFFEPLAPYLASMKIPNGANKDYEKIRELDAQIVQLMVERLVALKSMLAFWGLGERGILDSDRTLYYQHALKSAKEYCVLLYSDANAPGPVKMEARDVAKEVESRLERYPKP